MNNFFSSLCLTGVAAALTVMVIGVPDFNAHRKTTTDDVITGSVEGDLKSAFELTRNGEMRCMLRRGKALSGGTFRLVISPECEPVFENLETAQYWTDTADGRIILSGSFGPLIEFSPGDGPGYLSVHPAEPLFTLVRLPKD